MRYISNVKPENIEPRQVLKMQMKRLQFNNNKQVILSIEDTAGEEKYNSMQSLLFRKRNAFLIVFDVTDNKSFYDVEKWINEIK